MLGACRLDREAVGGASVALAVGTGGVLAGRGEERGVQVIVPRLAGVDLAVEVSICSTVTTGTCRARWIDRLGSSATTAASS